MPKAAIAKKSGKSRHDPLHVQLKEDEVASKYGRVSQPGKRSKSQKRGREGDNDEVILDPKTSRRIFELAKDQQDELDSIPDDEEDEEDDLSKPRTHFEDLNEEEEEEEEEYLGEGSVDAEEYAELQIDEGDMRTLDALMPSNAGDRRTLADIIFSKLDNPEETREKVPRQQRAPDPAAGLNPKVVEVYTKVGIILSRHKSGPLPKAFKMIPSLPQWARILALTNPTEWTPHAALAATRIFISNLKPEQARVFLEGVLLERVRSDMQENHDGRKLNVQLYEALKKAIYKPAAFFKGILFPLLQGGCTLKEAAIVGSVLSKVSVPVLHAAGALGYLAQMPNYTGPNSLFIRILLDKKHALPYKTLDSLVNHFIRLSNTYKAGIGESENLPVLWHQSLLVFCQRYASDLASDQKDALLDVVRVNPHPQISPEVRRELVIAVSRGEHHPTDGDVVMGAT